MKVLFYAAPVICAASMLCAQDITYGNAQYTYSSIDIDGEDVDIGGFTGSIGAAFGDIDVFADADYTEFELGGEDLEVASYEVGVGYTFGILRADISLAQLEASFLGFSDDSSLVEVGLGYNADIFRARVAYASLDDDTGLDGLFGLTVGIKFDDRTEASLSFHQTDPEADGVDEEDITILNISHDGDVIDLEFDVIDDDFSTGVVLTGDYALRNGFGINGSYSNISADGDDVDRIGVGGFYDIGNGFRVDGELFQIEADGNDSEGLRLGLTYDFGQKGFERQTQLDRLNHVNNRVLGTSF